MEGGECVGPEDRLLGHGNDGEVRNQQSIRTERAGYLAGRGRAAHDQHGGIRMGGRDRRPRPLEDDHVGPLRFRRRDRRRDRVVHGRSREAAAGPTGAHGGHAREGGVLVDVGRRVSARRCQRQERLHGRRLLRAAHDHGLGWPAPAHRHDDDRRAARGQVPRQGARNGRLARALAGTDHGDRRHGRQHRPLGWIEAEVRAAVGNAGGERARDEAEPQGGVHDRCVRHVDHDLRPVLIEGPDQGCAGIGIRDDREVAQAQRTLQFLDPPEHDGSDDVIAARGQRVERRDGDRRIVLAVDERYRAHVIPLARR